MSEKEIVFSFFFFLTNLFWARNFYYALLKLELRDCASFLHEHTDHPFIFDY